MCVDYFELNNACPKDNFPLPRISQIVDIIVRHELLSFLDAYSRYKQIPMLPKTPKRQPSLLPMGTYCYNFMPYNLKNVMPTYQRMIFTLFTMEVYTNDKLVKSAKQGGHVSHLTVAF